MNVTLLLLHLFLNPDYQPQLPRPPVQAIKLHIGRCPMGSTEQRCKLPSPQSGQPGH